MDIIPEAIEDARKNAKSLGLENAHYEWVKQKISFHVGTRKGIEQMLLLWIHLELV